MGTRDGKLAAAELQEHLLLAHEDERRRIAAEIHDDPVQALAAVQLRLAVLQRGALPPAAAEQVGRIASDVQGVLVRLRRLLFDLHPPNLDDEGLGAALRLYLAETFPPGVDVEVRDHGAAGEPAALRGLAYRVSREALRNVAQHAQARRVEIDLESSPRHVRVRVRDDGVGFHPSTVLHRPGHLGLSSMRQLVEAAGGTLRIESAPGQGTTVDVHLGRLGSGGVPPP